MTLAELAKQCSSPQEFMERIPNDSREIVFHQTGDRQKEAIEKEGFKTGQETGLAEKRGAIYAAGNTVNEGMYSRTDEGSTFAGQKPAKIAIDIRGLRLFDATKYGFASEIGKAIVKGDLSRLPPGYDGAIRFLDNGEVYEVALSAASATRHMITPEKLNALWRELRPDLLPHVPLLSDTTTLKEAFEQGKMIVETLIPDFDHQFRHLQEKSKLAHQAYDKALKNRKRNQLNRQTIFRKHELVELYKTTTDPTALEQAEKAAQEAKEEQLKYENSIGYNAKILASRAAQKELNHFMQVFLNALKQRVQERSVITESAEQYAKRVYSVDMNDGKDAIRGYQLQRRPEAMVETLQKISETLGRPWNVKTVVAKIKRGFFFHALKHVDIGWADNAIDVAFHEYGHAIEDGLPERTRLAGAFRLSRASNPIIVPLYPENDRFYKDVPGYVQEVGYEGNYFNRYCGRVYPGSNCTEILSMAAQQFTTPEQLAEFASQDIQHFYLFMACHPLARPGKPIPLFTEEQAQKA